jgi:hypothetical protein
MDYFYDGQIRRYVTQFMRFFIGFKYQAGDGTQKTLPVTYGDLSRQVAAIIKDNSENKMMTVPKISCYITGLEMDTARLAASTFVSKVNIRERDYEEYYPNDYPEVHLRGTPVYKNVQGGSYTVERMMPTPFMLTMKADLWTSNTDQKLQLLEQILVFFNPSFEIQTTDNFLDWTSLSVINLKNLQFSSRTIPQGSESDIDICSMEFNMPIYVTPPAKVKRLGVVKTIIANIYNQAGDVKNLDDILIDIGNVDIQFKFTMNNYGVLLLSANNGQPNDYNLSVINANEAVRVLGVEPPTKLGKQFDWSMLFDQQESFVPGLSMVYFTQPDGSEIRGTCVINPLDPSMLVVTITDKPSNSIINTKTYVDAIIDPYKYNPLEKLGGYSAINALSNPPRFLVLDDVNISENTGGVMIYGQDPTDGSSGDAYDGPDAWKNQDGTDAVIKNNSIIEWSNGKWITIFDPDTVTGIYYITNLKTSVQYKWEDGQWLRSFEGEYKAGYWRFDLNPA